MAFTDPNAFCPLAQTTLERVARENTGYLTRQRVGFLESLLSPANRFGFEQISVNNGNGGFRTVGINYIQAASPATIGTSKPLICTAPTNEQQPFAQLIDPSTMTKRYTSVMVFNEDQMAKLCDPTQDEYRATVMMAQFNALITEIDEALITAALPLIGNPYNTGAGPYTYVPPVAPINAPILNASDLSANRPGWIQAVNQRLLRMRISRTPIVVGLGDAGINLYMQLINEGCCNLAGIDLSASNGQAYFFQDQLMDVVAGNNQFLVYAPGAFQYVYFNEYSTEQGYNPRNKSVNNYYEQDTIIDPFSGLEVDMKMIYDTCTESYKMTLGTSFLLYALPATMYLNSDPMFGVRNSLRFTATTV